MKKTFQYKNEPFTVHPAKTCRFVWHLTRSSKRLEIALQGILPIYGMVFANNENEKIGNMWHWDVEDYWNMQILNHQDWHMHSQLKEKYMPAAEHLDFWRIDTQKINAQWYYDANLNDYSNPHRYVCTPAAIPKEAISLFHHDSRFFQKLSVQRTPGTASCHINNLALRKVDHLRLLAESVRQTNKIREIALEILPALLHKEATTLLAALRKNTFPTFWKTIRSILPAGANETDWLSFFEKSERKVTQWQNTDAMFLTIYGNSVSCYFHTFLLRYPAANDQSICRYFKLEYADQNPFKKHQDVYRMEEYLPQGYAFYSLIPNPRYRLYSCDIDTPRTLEKIKRDEPLMAFFRDAA